MDVTEKGWFKQWQHTVFANIEQAFVWGADDVTLLGIKGDLEKNYATLEEWPRLLENMQVLLKQSRVKGADWDKISEMRIALPKLKRQLEQAEGKSYIIIASCPSSHFDEAIALAQAASEPRNIFCSWGRADDVSGGLEDLSIAAAAPKPMAHPPEAAPSHGSAPIDNGVDLRIESKYCGRVLDVDTRNGANRSKSNGGTLTMWSGPGSNQKTGSNQKWRLEDAGDGCVWLVSNYCGRVLDVDMRNGKNQSKSCGGPLAMWEKLAGSNQKWRLEDAGDGCVWLVSTYCGRVRCRHDQRCEPKQVQRRDADDVRERSKPRPPEMASCPCIGDLSYSDGKR